MLIGACNPMLPAPALVRRHCKYAGDPKALMAREYDAVFFTCRKPATAASTPEEGAAV